MSRLRKFGSRLGQAGKYIAGGLLGAALAKSVHNRYQRRFPAPGSDAAVKAYVSDLPSAYEFLGYVPDHQVEFSGNIPQVSGQGKYRTVRKNGRRRYRRRPVRSKSTRSKGGIKELSKRLAFVAALAGAAGFGGYYGKVGARRFHDYYNQGVPPPPYVPPADMPYALP